MTRRPHDALVKSAFEAPNAAAALLCELLPPAVRDAIAWATLTREPGSFIDRTLDDRHNDLLFSAELRVGAPGRVFLLLEHQSTGDPAMPQRMLSYQSRIWDRFRKEHRRVRLPPVLAVLVSHVQGGWTDASSFEELFDPEVLALPGLAALMPRFSMLTLDLACQSNAELAARALAPFQKLALWLLRDARDSTRLLANFDAWLPELAAVARTRIDDLTVLIEYMFQVVDPLYRDDLRAKLHALGATAEEIAMTIAEQLREEGRTEGRAEGRTEGRAEGRTEGRAEGRIETLRRLLTFKFGALDPAAEARLQAATPEALDRYLQRVLVADSLAAVFAD